MATIEIEKGTEWHVRRQISNTLTDHDNRIVALEGSGSSVTIHTSGTGGTVPASASFAFITAQAAGGGGQGGLTDRGGAGGGGGAWGLRIPVAVTPSASYTYSIGAAGSGGAAGGTAGTNAGNLTLTISGQTFTFEGGRGGNGSGGRGGMPLGQVVNNNGGTGSGGANGNPGGAGTSYGAAGQGGGGGESTPVSQTGDGGIGGPSARLGGLAPSGAGGGGAFWSAGGDGGDNTPTVGNTPVGYGGGGGGGGAGGSGSGPLWVPTDLGSTLTLWLDASDSATITLSGSNVSDWADKSGNGYTFVQPSSGLQPAYQTAALNGLNTVRFAAGDRMANSSFPIPTSYTVYAVGNRSNSLSGYSRMLTATTDVRFLLGALNNEYITMFGSSGSGWASIAVNTPVQTVALASGASLLGFTRDQTVPVSTPYFDGTAQNTSAGNASAATGMEIGNSSVQTTQFWEGDVAEVVFANSTLSTADRQRLEGYLAHKWGIESQLPSGHPYRTNPPTTGASPEAGGAGAPGILVIEWA